MKEVRSDGAQLMTTSGLEEFKRLLTRSHEERDSIERELGAARTEASEATNKYLAWRDGFALRRLFKKKYSEIEQSAAELNAKVSELEEQSDLARIQMQVDAPATVLSSFHRMCDDFEKLCESRRIWDTLSERGVNRVVERTTAHSMIERRPVRFKRGLCDLIDSEWPVPHLENANGGDLYLFPTFVLYKVSAASFALLEYTEVQASYRQQRFIEEEEVPADSVVVDHTWAKANKDGSPDRRFTNNYQIPVVQYGELKLSSTSGLNEKYLVSSNERLRAFAASLGNFISTIRGVTSPPLKKPSTKFDTPQAARIMLAAMVSHIDKAGIRCKPVGIQRYDRTVRFDIRPTNRLSHEQVEASRQALVKELETELNWVGLLPKMLLGLEVPDARIRALNRAELTAWLGLPNPELSAEDQHVLERLSHLIEKQVAQFGAAGQVVDIEYGRDILRFRVRSEGAQRIAHRADAIKDALGCSIATPMLLKDELHFEISYADARTIAN